jgi:hypothetical protein
LRKGINWGLGSQGIWTPELEDMMFKEITNAALRMRDVSNRRKLLLDFADAINVCDGDNKKIGKLVDLYLKSN